MDVSTSKQVRVAIVEDDANYRRYLATVISSSPGYVCVGNHATGGRALKLLSNENPDVLLLDLSLPGRSGLDVMGDLSNHLPDLSVLVLTIQDTPEVIFRVLEAGAVGYLIKPIGPAELIGALDEVSHGGSPMSSSIARLVIQSFRNRATARRETAVLTEREQQVLRLLAGGHQRKEIAQQMQISLRSVAGDLRSIYRKLHARSGPEAVANYFGGERIARKG